MKLLSIILLRWRNGSAPLVLASEYNLAEFSFFTRGSVKEVALFVSREVVQRATSATLMSVKHKEYVCHAKVTSGGLAACVLADEVRSHFSSLPDLYMSSHKLFSNSPAFYCLGTKFSWPQKNCVGITWRGFFCTCLGYPLGLSSISECPHKNLHLCSNTCAHLSAPEVWDWHCHWC
jgi:hypothetical protein